jgi:hypothetical protein
VHAVDTPTSARVSDGRRVIIALRPHTYSGGRAIAAGERDPGAQVASGSLRAMRCAHFPQVDSHVHQLCVFAFSAGPDQVSGSAELAATTYS